MTRILSSKIPLVLSICFLLNVSLLTAQLQRFTSDSNVVLTDYEKSAMSIFDDLKVEPNLSITLESDFTRLIENKKEGKYQPAVMTYINSDGEIFQKALKIKARGKFRRKICDFPPLKLKFYKDDLTEDGFSPTYKSFKLVTHCLDSEGDKQNVLREFLAYKLFNKLTTQAFEVKLVEITYVNSSGDGAPETRFGFLIENTKEMSDRLGGDEIEEYNLDLNVMEGRDRHLFSMFQFMIGNTDWKTNMIHNIKIVKSDDGKETMMIPYDFDFAGLVNTSYARPNADYKQVSVRQRIYMDKVKNLEELSEIIRYFKKHKDGLFDVVKNTDQLNKKNKKDMLKYLNSFYDILDSNQQSRHAFVNKSL